MSRIDGLSELRDRLVRLQYRGARSVGGASLNAGLLALKSAVKDGCPGTIGDEVGSRRLRGSALVMEGVVGLGAGGAEKNVDNPHGHFLAAGTKNIEAEPFVRDAIDGATGAALGAMASAGSDALAKFVQN